jgi:hypothetical protein
LAIARRILKDRLLSCLKCIQMLISFLNWKMKLLASFELSALYNQVAIFDPSIEFPFNDWLPQHAAQGFTWRRGSVSFGTLNQSSQTTIEVWLTNEINIQENTVRAILVPFFVGPSSSIAVQSVVDPPGSNTVSISEGEYTLVFETGFREELRNDPDYQGRLSVLLPTWCRFTFIPQESAQPKILRADERLSPTYPLLMQADPA